MPSGHALLLLMTCSCRGWALTAPGVARQRTERPSPRPRLGAPLCAAAPRQWKGPAFEPSAPGVRLGVPASSRIPRALLLLMVFLHVVSNAVIAQALPTALLSALGQDRVRTAFALGRLGSCAALLDILLTPQMGRLSDTVGRKPLLLVPPCLGLVCRAAVAARPATPYLLGVKVLSGVLSATYMVALRAALADGHRDDAAALTGRLGLVSAASGAAYAIGMYAGGRLVEQQLRLPYAASAVALGALALVVSFGFRETLPREQRVPFRPREPGVSFVRLFRSGRALRGLASVNALQTISVSMGDTWQVFARELRGWGGAECGLFGSLTGLGGMVAALCVRPSVRLLGTRGHTLLATGCVVLTELLLGFAPGGRLAFVALLPNWIGRTQTTAVAARTTTVGASIGFGQGALAGDRQNLHALIKVFGPTMYGALFALGCQIGQPGLPFAFAAVVGGAAWLTALLTPRDVWEDPVSPAAQAQAKPAPT